MRVSEYLGLALKHKKNPLYVKYLAGRQVLDVGAGLGDFVAKDPEKIVGVEVDEQLVSLCRARSLDVRYMSALDLKFPDDSFDAVHAAQMIEHFSPTEAVRFLVEAARILRPSGVIFLTTPGVRNVWNTFSHVRPYPPSAFAKLLSRATEGYLQEDAIPLRIEAYYGNRRHHKNAVVSLLARVLDLLFPPNNPSGWTIILRKI